MCMPAKHRKPRNQYHGVLVHRCGSSSVGLLPTSQPQSLLQHRRASRQPSSRHSISVTISTGTPGTARETTSGKPCRASLHPHRAMQPRARKLASRAALSLSCRWRPAAPRRCMHTSWRHRMPSIETATIASPSYRRRHSRHAEQCILAASCCHNRMRVPLLTRRRPA